MADSRNVIEFVFRAVDQLSVPLAKMSGALGAVGRSLLSFRGFVAGAGAAAAFTMIVKQASEAQRATALMDNALKLVGTRAGITSRQLDEYANELQRTTTFSDEAAKESATLALRLGITGQALTRTVTAAADLAAATGGELKSATSTLARALADPARGMETLRRSGVVLTDTERSLIKQFDAAGEAAKAQGVILEAVERRYRGAADAASKTLGGALQRLRNVTGELFEGGQGGGVSKFTESVNALSDALSDPEVKRGFDEMASGLTSVAAAAVRAIAAVGRLPTVFMEASEAGRRQSELDSLIERRRHIVQGPEADALDRQIGAMMRGSGPDRGAFARGRGGDTENPLAGLEEIPITVRRITERAVDPVAELLEEMEEATATSVTKQVREWERYETDVRLLVRMGVISAEEGQRRISEYTDNILSEVEVTSKKMLPKVHEQLNEVSIALRATVEGAAQDVNRLLTNAFELRGNGRDILRNLLEVVRRTMAQMAAIVAQEVLGINALLNSIGSNVGGGSIGGGGGLIGGIIGGIFGGVAGVSGAGAGGPSGQIITGPMKAGGGGFSKAAVVYSPVTQVTLQSGSEAELAALAREMQRRDARNLEQWSQVMTRNGFKLR